MLLTLLLLSGPAWSQVMSETLLLALESAPAGADVPVLVRVGDRLALEPYALLGLPARRRALVAALEAHATQSQAALRSLLRRRGVERVESLWIGNLLALAAPAPVIEELASRPEVESIELDATFEVPPTASSDAPPPAEWNLEAIRAPELWALGSTGAGSVVATLDTGVDPAHPDLAARWRGGTNSWFDASGEHASPYDADGHGTRTLGVLVGGDAGGSAIGVAPGARWIAARIFDDAGVATASGIHGAFQWALDPDGDPGTDDAPHVVNGSWYDALSVGACDPEFQVDLEVLRAAEIAVVLSAGNAGPDPGSSAIPANLPGGVAVGALDAALEVADFSSRGPSACGGGLFPSLVAPGVEVRTADLTLGGAFPNSYATVSGTSFSAPHVAGTLALLRSAFPGTSVAQLEHALLAGAVDLGEAGPDDAYGHGQVDGPWARSFLAATTVCANGQDDDADGLSDFPEDPGCRAPLAAREDPACDDGVDNDHDGLVDFGSDPQCSAASYSSEAGRACGLGFEAFVPLLAVLAWRRRKGRR